MNKKQNLIIPKHLALIPDGNRRWARSHSFEVFKGHKVGIDRFIEFANWSKDFGVKMITVWALSTENLTNRPPMELKVLFNLYTKAAYDKGLRKMLADNKIRLRIIGNLAALPAKLRNALLDIEAKTREYGDYTINLLINYGGHEDLLYSAQKAVKDAKNGVVIDEKYIEQHLRTAQIPNVDLIVRTSGEMRLSGLLPWQGAYAELYFAKKYWPDFKRADLKRAVETFSKRQRRFGK